MIFTVSPTEYSPIKLEREPELPISVPLTAVIMSFSFKPALSPALPEIMALLFLLEAIKAPRVTERFFSLAMVGVRLI